MHRGKKKGSRVGFGLADTYFSSPTSCLDHVGMMESLRLFGENLKGINFPVRGRRWMGWDGGEGFSLGWEEVACWSISRLCIGIDYRLFHGV